MWLFNIIDCDKIIVEFLFQKGDFVVQKAIEIVRDGMTMRGMLHRPDNVEGKLPIALIFHGFTGHKMESHFIFVKLSRQLEKAGMASLRFDFLGSGESDGDFVDMTLSGEVKDAQEILEFAKSIEWVDRDRIYVVGLSMGGAVASILAGQHSDDIERLCLWAPAGNMPELIKYRLDELKKEKAIEHDFEHYDLGGFLLGRGFVEDLMSLDIYALASSYDGEVLIVHGDRDQSVPLSASHKYLDIYGSQAKLHIVEGADHTFNKFEWEKEAIDTTVDYLTK